MTKTPTSKRPEPTAYDDTPSIITSHPFEAMGAWYTLCKHCSLAESAHKETLNPPFHYVSDDVEEID